MGSLGKNEKPGYGSFFHLSLVQVLSLAVRSSAEKLVTRRQSDLISPVEICEDSAS